MTRPDGGIMRLDISAKIRTYEDSPRDLLDEKIEVKSHWNEQQMVWLIVKDEMVLVCAADLLEAVRRCS